MIQANSLRINNWVYDHKKEMRQVAYISQDTFGLYNEIGGVQRFQIEPVFSQDIADATPIELSEEVLVKLGFKKQHDSFYQLSDEILINKDKCFWWTDYWEANVEFGFNALKDWRKIYNLHELQNLVYANTKTELNYKP